MKHGNLCLDNTINKVSSVISKTWFRRFDSALSHPEHNNKEIHFFLTYTGESIVSASRFDFQKAM